MSITRIGNLNNRFIGLSSDTKPTECQVGATFFESDTGKLYHSPDGGTTWVLKDAEGVRFESTTWNLKQVAGDYDLFEAGYADIELLHLTAIIPADLTGDAAGSLTAISIQTTDDTPVELISATDGAKANLSSGAYLQYEGNDVMPGGKKIQGTITGGATSADQYVIVFVAYREAV